MSDKQREQDFLDKAKAALDEGVEQFDALTLARLRSARRRALESTRRRSPWWIPAGGLAAASIAVLAVVLWFKPVGSDLVAANVEDIELLTTADNLELYEELDFYRWLVSGGADAG